MQRQQAPEQPDRRADLAAVGSLLRRWAVEAAEELVGAVDEMDFHRPWFMMGTGMAKPPALRQVCLAHQVSIDLARRAAAFVDGPNHKALPTAHVAGRKDARYAGGEFSVVCLGIRTFIPFHA